MKQQAIQYVALDVHQATLVVSVRDEQGSVVMRATVATEAKAIVGLVRGLGSRVHIAFEEGTQAQWLHDVLKPHAERVVVCNMRGRGTTDNKSDRIDADRLSELLRMGSVKSVYHGASGLLTLKELVKSYVNLVEDGTRVMLRIKALFRGCGIKTPGKSVYQPSKRRGWVSQLEGRGARMRAEALFTELDVLQELRPKAKAAMIAEARRQPGWKVLRSIPFLGPVRVAEILAIMATPWRFRTKRQAWPYVGLAVVTRSSADQEFADGKLRRRRRAPLTRGLNRKSPSSAQVGVQGGGECSGRAGRSAQEHLRRVRRSWRPRGHGQADPGAQDRGDRAAPVEDRRALGCNEADSASDIALG